MRVCMCVCVCVCGLCVCLCVWIVCVFVEDYLYYMHYLGPVIIDQFFK